MNPEDKKKMQDAADNAAKEFPTTGTAQEVAEWWNKWFMAAGHKRLAYILMAAYGLRNNHYLSN